MKDVAIKVVGLGKKYSVNQTKSGDFRNSFNNRIKNIFKNSRLNDQIFWALKDLNFEIFKGDTVGIIGNNGAGKSTLLKILSQITHPSCGKYEINGRTSSLLEVGTGFHSELTGRENIFLNGTILGMKRYEIKRKFDEIVFFSGVETFLDTPVKHYSSGMKVRLAFSVAAHLEPEILIIDEVLAVGDADFQKKCLGKMDEVSKSEGRTIIFVSHDMNAVQKLCKIGILLQNGKISYVGTALETVNVYQKASSYNKNLKWIQNRSLSNPHFQKVSLKLTGEQPYMQLEISFTINSVINHRPAFVAFDIRNSRNSPIMQVLPEIKPFILYSDKIQNYKCIVQLIGLVPDTYFISPWIGAHNNSTFDFQQDIASFEIIDSPSHGRTVPHTPDHGSIVPLSQIISCP